MLKYRIFGQKSKIKKKQTNKERTVLERRSKEVKYYVYIVFINVLLQLSAVCVFSVRIAAQIRSSSNAWRSSLL